MSDLLAKHFTPESRLRTLTDGQKVMYLLAHAALSGDLQTLAAAARGDFPPELRRLIMSHLVNVAAEDGTTREGFRILSQIGSLAERYGVAPSPSYWESAQPKTHNRGKATANELAVRGLPPNGSVITTEMHLSPKGDDTVVLDPDRTVVLPGGADTFAPDTDLTEQFAVPAVDPDAIGIIDWHVVDTAMISTVRV